MNGTLLKWIAGGLGAALLATLSVLAAIHANSIGHVASGNEEQWRRLSEHGSKISVLENSVAAQRQDLQEVKSDVKELLRRSK